MVDIAQRHTVIILSKLFAINGDLRRCVSIILSGNSAHLEVIALRANAEIDFAARLERVLNTLFLAPFIVCFRVKHDLLLAKADAAVQRNVGRSTAMPFGGQVDNETVA